MTTSAPLSPGLTALLREPVFAHIATLMADGSPQVTQTWVDTDGEHVLINTVATHQKTRNVRRDPRVAVNVHDGPAMRMAHIRGRVVAIVEDGADDHIDQLAGKYLGQGRYPWRRPGEQRVILKIQPEHIASMGLDGRTWPSPDRTG